jgi:carboxymethylenebutenolidase
MPDIKIKSLEGQEFGAYCAMPPLGHGGGLVLIQEIFGVNANMRKICDAFAAKGYITLCPDLFWRLQPGLQLDDRKPQDLERAFDLFGKFDIEGGLRDLLSTLAHLRAIPGGNGKVGAIGYCLGGKLAFLMSARSDVDATVSYYGVGLEQHLDDIHDISMPLMLHIAEKDKFVPPEARQKILDKTARNSLITAHVYEGVDHAFARVGGDHYNAEAAALANQRTDDFLAVTLQH